MPPTEWDDSRVVSVRLPYTMVQRLDRLLDWQTTHQRRPTTRNAAMRDALRGYRELHVRAFKLLSRDGLLATFSCSHHVTETIFDQTMADALVDARRSARRLRRFEQALDHPVLPTLPETEYFKGVLLEMMPGR